MRTCCAFRKNMIQVWGGIGIVGSCLMRLDVGGRMRIMKYGTLLQIMHIKICLKSY